MKLKIFRFNPQQDSEPHYDTFKVEANLTDRILDCLNKIRWQQDSSLSYRMSCAHGICGSDGMTINGVAALACQKLVKDYGEEILIEPLKFFEVIKDLIVDVEPFFSREKFIHPANGIGLSDCELDREHFQTIQERERFDDDVKCIRCACCTSACPVNQKEDSNYIGPAAIVNAHRFIFDSRIVNTKARLMILNEPHGAWSCKGYYKCTQVCPKGIQVTKHIMESRRKIIEALRQKSKEKI